MDNHVLEHLLVRELRLSIPDMIEAEYRGLVTDAAKVAMQSHKYAWIRPSGPIEIQIRLELTDRLTVLILATLSLRS